MKYYIPAIIFVLLYGLIAILGVGTISTIVVVWISLFLLSGFIMTRKIFWGSIFGIIPAVNFIYIGTKDTGQIINEIPIGIAILLYYLICGIIIYKNNQKENTIN